MSKQKRKQQSTNEGRVRPSKRRNKSVADVYEAADSDPDEERNKNRYDQVENYEYEMPSDFEDEEIDEELAFTEEDKRKYAGWFDGDGHGSEGSGDGDLLNSEEDDDEADEVSMQSGCGGSCPCCMHMLHAWLLILGRSFAWQRILCWVLHIAA